MKFWFDTEFIEDGKTIDLISIGIVAEDGREYYAENSHCDFYRASPWVIENVIPHLTGGATKKPPGLIGAEIVAFVGEKPEFWAYYAGYDWVALCQLFGTMMDLPKGWPMYCRDVKQLCDALGNPQLPPQGRSEHHALADARWTKAAWEFLKPAPPLSPPIACGEEELAKVIGTALYASEAEIATSGAEDRETFVARAVLSYLSAQRSAVGGLDHADGTSAAAVEKVTQPE